MFARKAPWAEACQRRREAEEGETERRQFILTYVQRVLPG